MVIFHSYVAVYQRVTIQKYHIYSWFTYSKWWFSIAMLVYQRVPVLIHDQDTHPLRRAIPRCQATPAPLWLQGALSCRGAPPGRPGRCPRFQRWSRWRRPHILLGIFGFLWIFRIGKREEVYQQQRDSSDENPWENVRTWGCVPLFNGLKNLDKKG